MDCFRMGISDSSSPRAIDEILTVLRSSHRAPESAHAPPLYLICNHTHTHRTHPPHQLCSHRLSASAASSVSRKRLARTTLFVSFMFGASALPSPKHFSS
ncbi:hypothetical protein PENSPDRAFT_254264 [Peniophora sp. CONT]|nr:hypothetical protein PENSPDRAFT_254264 [Peniophora sp. CONT]